MGAETIFRIIFWILFGGLIIIQVYFASRVKQAGERVTASDEAIQREGWGYVVIRLISSLALLIFLVLYAIQPPWFGVLAVPFPTWLRWIGAVLGCASFLLYLWSQNTLGKEWSPHLQMREIHRLVTIGPYARIRHPIYLAYLVFMTSITLVTATFGEEYKVYKQKTGGLLPK
jgi:protein-S-isoprenylcysteine O-methyltransferase Ste14